MKTKDTPKQYVIYSRKSKFTGKGESIENQIELCRQYIAMHFGEDAAENVLVYEDEGFSGGNLERPQFKKMMKDSQKIAFAAIVVYRLDRISRNIGDFAKLIEDLGDRHIDFISIREQFDTSSPMGRAMMYIASVFSQLERETIAERIRALVGDADLSAGGRRENRRDGPAVPGAVQAHSRAAVGERAPDRAGSNLPYHAGRRIARKSFANSAISADCAGKHRRGFFILINIPS